MGDMCKTWKEAQECMTKKLDVYIEECGDKIDPDTFEKITNGIHYLGESIYYHTVTEAMNDVSDEEKMRNRSKWGYTEPMWEYDQYPKMGYNATGYNDRMGFKPYLDQEPYVRDYISSDYGKEYDEWKDAKRHYTESHSMNDRKKMDDKALNHIDNFVMTFKEMWKDADPTVRHDMKDELTEIMDMLKTA